MEEWQSKLRHCEPESEMSGLSPYSSKVQCVLKDQLVRMTRIPKERRIDFWVNKTFIKFLGDYRPQLTRDTKVVESLCKRYIAFLNPGCSGIFRFEDPETLTFERTCRVDLTFFFSCEGKIFTNHDLDTVLEQDRQQMRKIKDGYVTCGLQIAPDRFLIGYSVRTLLLDVIVTKEGTLESLPCMVNMRNQDPNRKITQPVNKMILIDGFIYILAKYIVIKFTANFGRYHADRARRLLK